MIVPARVVTGGPFGDKAYYVPFTRIPVGKCVNHQLPSLLDFFLACPESITDSWVDWLPAFADHALVAAAVGSAVQPFKPRGGR